MTPADRDPYDEPLPETLELRPARVKWLIIFLISAGFVSIAVFIGPADKPLTRLGSGGFFALCGLIALPQMLGAGSSLSLDLEGFTHHTLFSSFRRRWTECSAFEPMQIGLRTMVCFSAETDEAKHPRLAAIARGLAGASGALTDTYGFSAADLADLMNRFRNRALGL